MAKQKAGDDGPARLGEPGVLILLALSDGPKHGYAITTDVAENLDVRLGPGTLYGALTTLAERGLVAALPAEERRRPYEITAAGRAALETHLASLARTVDVGRRRLGWA